MASRRGPGEIALGLVLLGVVVGLALVAQDHWKQGLSLMGVTLLGGGRCCACCFPPAGSGCSWCAAGRSTSPR